MKLATAKLLALLHSASGVREVRPRKLIQNSIKMKIDSQETLAFSRLRRRHTQDELSYTTCEECTINVVLPLPLDPEGEDSNLYFLGLEGEDSNPYFLCEMDPSDVVVAGLIREMDVTDDQMESLMTMLSSGELVPGESKLVHGQGTPYDESYIYVGQDLDIRKNVYRPSDQGRRRLQPPVIGVKPMLAVRVIDSDGLAGPPPDVISDKFFGSYEDAVNLKSQLAACSFNQLKVEAGIGNLIEVDQGVAEVTINIPFIGNSLWQITNLISLNLRQQLGTDSLPGPYKHIMYIIPTHGCIGCNYAGMANVPGYLSWFFGKYYSRSPVQVHELGHNFGLYHSGGICSTGRYSEYCDHTCSMGSPLYTDDGRMCFNPAKSWQLRWFESKSGTKIIDPSDGPSSFQSAKVTIVGVAEYDIRNDPTNQPVSIKIEANCGADFFVGFNRATGANADNDEHDDKVIVNQVLQGGGERGALSFLNAALEEHETYTIPDFAGTGSDLYITAERIDIDSAPGVATVSIGWARTCYDDGLSKNFGFEDGNFGCWTTNFNHCHWPTPRVEKEIEVYDKNGDLVTYEAYFGDFMATLPGGCLTSMISKLITVPDLAAVSGAAKWIGGDYLPRNDSSLVRIVEGDTVLFQASILQYGDWGVSPWTRFVYMPPVEPATYTVEAFSTNSHDCGMASYLLFDLQENVVNPGGPYIISVGSPGGQLNGALTTIRDNVSAEWKLQCPSGGGDMVKGIFNDPRDLQAMLSFDSETAPTICSLTLTAINADTGMPITEASSTIEASTEVIVVNPSAGFVTGGGWIMSPEGAYRPDQLLVGPANFGFVSKYQKGRSAPTGQTTFVFDVARFSFKSTAYDWLVVTGSDCTKFKGKGTVNNGSQEHGFMLTACDNGEGVKSADDTFRVKIWDDDGVIYDNKRGTDDGSYDGTAISGGNIQIHQGTNNCDEVSEKKECKKQGCKWANGVCTDKSQGDTNVDCNDVLKKKECKQKDCRWAEGVCMDKNSQGVVQAQVMPGSTTSHEVSVEAQHDEATKTLSAWAWIPILIVWFGWI